jgi:hypothetical protein
METSSTDNGIMSVLLNTFLLIGVVSIGVAYYMDYTPLLIVALIIMSFFIREVNTFTKIILWIFYLLYLLSPILYDFFSMSPKEAMYHNFKIVGIFIWLSYFANPFDNIVLDELFDDKVQDEK